MPADYSRFGTKGFYFTGLQAALHSRLLISNLRQPYSLFILPLRGSLFPVENRARGRINGILLLGKTIGPGYQQHTFLEFPRIGPVILEVTACFTIANRSIAFQNHVPDEACSKILGPPYSVVQIRSTDRR